MNTVPCLIAQRQDREVLSEECLRSAAYFLSHLRFTVRQTKQRKLGLSHFAILSETDQVLIT